MSESERNLEKLNVHNVLRPQLVRVNGNCYRNMRIIDTKSRKTNNVNVSETPKPYQDNEDVSRCEGDYVYYDIEIMENGRFKTSISVPQKFYSYIIGTKGSRRKHIEQESGAQISIPKNRTDKVIRISGPTEKSVSLARRKIELISFDLREKHEITHFISYPMISDEIIRNFNLFKVNILSGPPVNGVDETIFQNGSKLHLTIATFVLMDDDEKYQASKALNTCKKEVLDPLLQNIGPIAIRMKGLQYMNDDPSQVDILYAKVHVINNETNSILQKISDEIVEYFSVKGLMETEYDKVKLHVTVINTRYRKDLTVDKNERKRYPKRIPIDARPILEKYGDFDFGVQEFTNIHLSARFSVGENGYYECVHGISCL